MAYTEYVTTLGDIANAFAAAAASSSPNAPTTFQVTPTSGSAKTFTFANGVGIRSFASRTGFVRVWDPKANGASASPLTANLPQLTFAGLVPHGQFDDARPWYRQGGVVGATTSGGQDVWGSLDVGNPQWGMIEVRPVWAATTQDIVDTASVQTFKADALTQVVLTADS